MTVFAVRSTRAAPAGALMEPFGPIAVTTFGTTGEVMLIPDASTRVYVPFAGSPAEHFYLGDLQTLEGAPWTFCPRHILRRALDRLMNETGFGLRSSNVAALILRH